VSSPPSASAGNIGFNFFALTAEVVAHVGLFDENIFPAFWEDRDYQRRLSLWPGARVKTFRALRLWHGVDASPQERVQVQGGKEQGEIPGGQLHGALLGGGGGGGNYTYTSGTVYLGRPWALTMQWAARHSMDYLMRKWGCNRTLTELEHHLVACRHMRPFGDPALGLAYWQLNSTAVQSIRDFYAQAVSAPNETAAGTTHPDAGGHSPAVNNSGSLSSSLSSSRVRVGPKYSFQEVRGFHRARRSKVIRAHKRSQEEYNKNT
jgi:hypothetical protein